MYICLGGVLYEKSCGLRLKIVHFFFSASNLILGILPAVACFYQFFEKGATLLMFFNYSFSFNGPMLIWIINWITYHCKEDVKATLDLIDNDFGFQCGKNRQNYGKDWVRPFNVGAWFSFIVILDIICIILLMFGRYIYILILADEKILNDHLSYIWACPFVDEVNSFTAYTIVYMIQSFFFSSVIIKGSMMPILALIICGIYYNQFVYLVSAMTYDSQRIEKIFDDIIVKPECRLEPLEEFRIMKSLDADFRRKFVQYLRSHRALLK